MSPRSRFRWFIPASLAVASAVLTAPADPAAAWTAEQRAVMAPIQKLLEGVVRHDKAMISSALMPEGVATLMRHGKPVQMRLAVFPDRMPPLPMKVEERIHEPWIRIDHDFTMVWTYYDYWRDGKLDHCGTDLYTLVRQEDGSWIIAGIADNARHDCPGN
jgi:hypothetical protein